MTGTAKLTPRQAEVLAFVEDRHRSAGFCPSQKEIAAHFGFRSTFAVREHLRLIEQKGFLCRVPGKSRAIRITGRRNSGTGSFVEIPLLGRIPAGQPLAAIEDHEATIPIGRGLFRGQQLFALRVHGDSMKDVGICDGDIAVLNHQPEVENGEIAAVLIDDDATLKRVVRTRDGVILRAENPAFRDIVIPSNERPELRIAGRLVGIIRSI
jgi:repressor LexA